MNWSSMFNGIFEAVVITLTLVLLFYLVYSMNLRLFGAPKKTLASNESMAIFTFGTFIGLGILCRPMILTLNSQLAILGFTDSFVIVHFAFYQILFKLLLVTVLLYFLVIGICVLLFSTLTFSLNIFRDLGNDNRKSAIILCGLIISIFYTCGTLFDTIFSTLLESPGNDFIY